MDTWKPDSKYALPISPQEHSVFLGADPSVTQPQSHQDLLDKIGGIVNRIFPGGKIGEAIGNSISGVHGYLTGNKDEVKAASDANAQLIKPVAGDAAQVVSTGLAAAMPIAGSIAGKVAQFGALGGLSGAGGAAKENASGADILKAGAGGAAIGAGTGLAFGLAERGFRAIGDLFGKAGDKIQNSVIKPTSADIKDGFSIDTVKKYNLGGSLKTSFEKTDTKLDSLSKQLNEKLAGSNASVNLNDVYERTAKRLLGNKLESFGANGQLEGAIEKLRNEIVSVSGENGLVSVPEAQIVKRASGHFGAWTFGVPTPEATASQKVYNTFYNELKTQIEKSSPEGVKDINKQMAEIIPVMNALIRRIPVAERNSTLSLTDIISLTGATINPHALGVSLLNLASKSGTVGNALSKFAPAIGRGIANTIQKAEPIARTIIGR